MTTHLVFLLLGLANGAVYASLALALVVTFRSSGVINFATGSIALFAAYTYGFLREGKLLDPIPGLPVTVHLANKLGFAPAALLTLVITALLGLVMYLVVFRPIRNAPAVARAVASLGVTVLITGLMQQRVGDNPVNVNAIFPSSTWTLGKVHVSADRVYFALTVVALAALIAAGYRFTRFGLHTRAAAETEKGAFVSGISPDRIAAVNWMISAMVAAVAGILIAPIVPLVPSAYSLFIVPALAAAILGRFQGIVVAVVGGLVIGMLQSDTAYLNSHYSWLPESGLPQLIPLVLILIVLVWRAPNLPLRGELIRGTLGRAPRPRGLALPTAAGLIAGGVALVVLHGQWRAALVASFAFGIIALSQVVVTGFAGQVSLAQLVLAGCAGFLLSPVTESWGIPFPIAPIVAALGSMAVGLLVGLPAARVRGLPLAVVTLALAVAVEAFWFQDSKFVPSGGKNIKGPSLFGLNLRVGAGGAYPRLAFCFMVIIVLALVGIGVAKLRTSRLGAAMLAVRANERSAAAAGVNVVRTKLAAFAIAGFVAGIGGALLAYQQTNVTYEQFDAILGLGLFATAYLAGVTSVSGGVLAGVMASGGLIYEFLQKGLHLGGWYDALSGIGLILTVIFNPEGIVGPFHLKLAALRARRQPADVAAADLAPAAGTPSAGPGRRPAPAGAQPVLTVEEIGVRYGAVVAVDSVSFEVAEGLIVGLIGPNGAGKTTLIDALSGFAPCTGSVSLVGAPLDGMRPDQRARAGLGRTFQAMELWDDLTVGENVGVSSRGGKRDATTEITDTLDLLGIRSLADRAVGELSQGQRQMVSIARALLGKPKVLLLDEPAAGLDSTESLWLGERLRAVRDGGVTIVMVDHDMGLVLGLCDEIRVLNFGEVIAAGPPDVIRADPVVASAYLGSTHAHLAEPAVNATSTARVAAEIPSPPAAGGE
ncbi:ATP-binding cassette domain-containing protein [Acidiferrimicrobium sp. IK]|uniref:branched-chain amino acid ABC transporter permease/ATP-binding protein n=1 Tax=Acidiferrimicrobium sp. IK TaxID=2871700 RepID=UPI0021CB50C6|nr:branched-chain amino acid ABC transporter permease/ATP-binding protein [Acidiferrimicrobium sp. IK]MCU4186355.1 ATP-binding cassette domain-containing protein [Acidiferrimicrobium sp. IK]